MVLRDKFINAAALSTLSNVIGRSANILIAYSVLMVYGATVETDQFFFVLAVAYLFFGTAANALCEATVTLAVHRQAAPRPLTITAGGLGAAAVVLAGTTITGRLDAVYAFALALMAGAGICNGIAAGFLHAAERYVLTGASWSVRLAALAIYYLLFKDPLTLKWLALFIGLADWTRFWIMNRTARSVPACVPSPQAGSCVKKILVTYGAFFVAMMIFGVNPLVDRWVASLGGPGGISLLEAGGRIYDMLASVGSMGLMSVLLTHVAQAAARNDLSRKWRGVVQKVVLWCTGWLLIGVICGLWPLGWWLRTFTDLETAQTALVVRLYWYYLPGMPALLIFATYVKRVQALGYLRTLVWLALFSVAANLGLSLLLRLIMGLPGIALATTLTHYAAAFATAAVLHGRQGRPDRPHAYRSE